MLFYAGLFFVPAFFAPGLYSGTCPASAGQMRRAVEGVPQAQGAEIALTFDDGPSPAWTPWLLDGLKERGVKASFFLIGENAEKSPDIVKRMDAEGHLIGNHTYRHVSLKSGDRREAEEELKQTDRIIFEITGKHTGFVRPPFGEWDEGLEKSMEVLPVMWTVDPLDWRTESEEEIVDRVVTEAEEGDIILLHDCYQTSVKAALRIVDILQERGFRFVTADEMIG